MSKQTLRWCCALLATAPWWANHPVATQSTRAEDLTARQFVSDAARQIQATLDQPLKTPLYYDEEPLDTVLEAISDEYDLTIVIDEAALDELAISTQSEVSVRVRNISLRSALNLVLKEPGLEDLCHVVEDEVLLITTVERANETLRVLVYRVDDLLDAPTRRFNATSVRGDPDTLIDLIVANVERDAWIENGTGEGELRYYPPGMLIISQTQRVHDQVQELLDKMRHTKHRILADSGAKTVQVKPATLGFAIQIELGSNPEQVQEQLTHAVKQSVDWSAPGAPIEEEDVWIQVLPDRVLVHHLPVILSQVGTVLNDMRILDLQRSGGGGGIGCDPRYDPAQQAKLPDLAE